MKKIVLVFVAVVFAWFLFSEKIDSKVYVAVEGEGAVVVINPNTNKEIYKIDLSEQINNQKIYYMPHNIQVAPDNKSIWVTANSMTKMDHGSFKIIQNVYAEEGHGDSYSTVDDQVIIIDPFTESIIKRINIGKAQHLSHIELTTDSKYAIVAAQEKDILYKISTESFKIESKINIESGNKPHGLRISPDGKTSYIAMFGGKSLGILDIDSMTMTYVNLTGAVVQTGVTSDGKYALASLYDTKSLAVYNINSKEVNYVNLPKESKGPVQLYPMPDSKFVYVADQGYYSDQPISEKVYKIDINKMEVIDSITVGRAPHGVVISKNGELAYVTNLLSGDISVIDTKIDKEVERIKVGKEPNGISIWYKKDSHP